MCISPDNRRLQKHLIGSIIASLFCALFAGVYEAFSFGVYSYFMLFAFVVPLLCCALPYSLFVFRNRHLPGKTALRLWNSGAAVLTVGFIMQGVIEIYGTTNRLLLLYWIVGALFCLCALAVWLLPLRRTKTPAAFPEQQG